MPPKYVVEKPLLEVGNILGEGCVWDERSQRLYFVDIDGRKVYTYEPSSGIHGYQAFEKKITAIALLETESGLLATAEDGYVYLPASSLPFPPDSSLKPFIPLDHGVQVRPGTNRWNEAAVDPAGRYLAGTMGFEHGEFAGVMYSLRPDGKGGFTAPEILDNITCTNGMGWTSDAKTMYFTDSWIKEIATFDYDIDTGKMSNRKTFSLIEDEAYGWPDGMCMDDQGGIWSARWGAGKVIRLTPDGKIDVEIDFPTAWNMTCCIFGAWRSGPELQDLYVTSASSAVTGESVDEKPNGGDLFVVKGLGFTGVNRNRFKGKIAA